MVRLRQQIEVIDLFLAEEGATDIPADALVHALVANTDAVEHFECALGIADAARTDRHRIVVIKHDHRHARLGQFDRPGQTNRAGTDDNDRITLLDTALLLRRLNILVLRVLIGTQHCCLLLLWLLGAGAGLQPGIRPENALTAGRATFPCRARQSRCAGV